MTGPYGGCTQIIYILGADKRFKMCYTIMDYSLYRTLCDLDTIKTQGGVVF